MGKHEDALVNLDEAQTSSEIYSESENDITCGNSGTADNPFVVLSSKPLFIEKPEYPLDALGSILGEAAEALAYYVQAPKGMAGQSVLAAAALVSQAHIQVKRGTIGVCPVSLYLLSVAGSGDRKSSLDKLALEPVRRFQESRIQTQAKERAEYNAAFRAWQLRKESIEKATKKSNKPINSGEQAKLAEQLFALEIDKPKVPRSPNITIEEPTPEAVWRHLQHGEPSAGLFSDEGITFFAGHGMNNESRGRMIGTLSQLWDGKALTRTRAAEGESGVMTGRCLSAHLMIQPVVSQELFKDKLLMLQGFLARFLVCDEMSIAGTRFLAGRDSAQGPRQDTSINRYWVTLDEHLNRPMNIESETGSLILETLVIEGEAYDDWVTLHDGIEFQLADNGPYAGIKAFGSKGAENAARIAAILAFIEGFTQPQPEHIKRAGRLMSFYLESIRLKICDAQKSKDMLEAEVIYNWVKSNGGELVARDFNKLPNAYRAADKARSVLKTLVNMGCVIVTATDTNGRPSAWMIICDD